jgi:hypothetical protein
MRPRKSGSQQTRRWRKTDSNPWSRPRVWVSFGGKPTQIPRYPGPCRFRHGHRRPYGKWAELSGRESNTTMHQLMGRLPRLSAICSAQLAIPSTPRPNLFWARLSAYLLSRRKPERNAKRRSGNRVPPEGFDSWKNCGTCGTIATTGKTRSTNHTEASLRRCRHLRARPRDKRLHLAAQKCRKAG